LRLLQASLAALLMLASVGVMHYGAALGVVDRPQLGWWTLVSLGGSLSFFALIRSGCSQRFGDPSMTVAQMAYAIVCAAWGYAISGTGHGAVPLILAVVLMFGMFGLTTRQVVAVGAFTLLVFAAVMLRMSQADPRRFPAGVECEIFAMMAIVIVAVIVLTARLHRMRDRLRLQRAELKQAVDRIRQLATRDELTGLVNRRHMQELLESERQRSLRRGLPLCIALIDVDHFKRINDAHGHAVGDAVLRALASRGQAQLRGSDVLARWGGEEFVVMLPDTQLATASAGVDRLRERLAESVLCDAAPELRVSFSAGIAQLIGDEPIARTLERADRALYAAKAQGRNRVETAD
jgi:diguanylate cyclase (GGDEF)-like protein